MAVSVAFSPKCYGSHTLMVQPHETADRLLRAAVQTQCDDVDLRGRHVVLVHKKRELVGLKTAADYSIESADTLHLKLFDRYGNQLRWDDYSYVKEYGAGDHNYHTLAEAFEEDPYADESPAEMRSLARLAGVNPGFVTDWFMWARAAGGVGGDEPGDRGRVAQAERRAENAGARADAAARAAAQAQASLAQQQQMALSVYGETVSIRPDHLPSQWLDTRPNSSPEWAPLLDTGNGAATMVSESVACAAGLRASPHRMTIAGVNGVDEYPMAYCRVRIRGVEQRVCAAIGGAQGILVGRDVIEPMLDMGHAIAGFSAVRGNNGGAYSIRRL